MVKNAAAGTLPAMQNEKVNRSANLANGLQGSNEAALLQSNTSLGQSNPNGSVNTQLLLRAMQQQQAWQQQQAGQQVGQQPQLQQLQDPPPGAAAAAAAVRNARAAQNNPQKRKHRSEPSAGGVAQSNILHNGPAHLSQATLDWACQEMQSLAGRTLFAMRKMLNWGMGQMWIQEENVLRLVPHKFHPDEHLDSSSQEFWNQCVHMVLDMKEGTLPCQVWRDVKPKLLDDIGTTTHQSTLHKCADAAGYKSELCIPIVYNKKVISVLVFFNMAPQSLQSHLQDLAKAAKAFLVDTIELISKVCGVVEPELLSQLIPPFLVRASRCGTGNAGGSSEGMGNATDTDYESSRDSRQKL